MRMRISFTMMCAVLFFMTPSVWGAFPAMSIDEMIDKADLIFVGTINSIDENVTVSGKLLTKSVHLSVVELLKHRTEVPLLSTTSIEVTVIGERPSSFGFDSGERVLLFCRYDVTSGKYRSNGGSLNIFRIRLDRRRNEYFVYSSLRSVRSKPAEEESAPLINIESGHARFGDSRHPPVSARDFLKVIRSHLRRK
jgi:hypothetical protein